MRVLKLLPRVSAHGVIDMHVHIGPEFLPRRYSPLTLAEEARREGIGVVMKNHFQPTTALAKLACREDDDVPIIGSVTLNHSCGGIDDHGIRSAMSGWKSDPTQIDPDNDRFVVWMPTLSAEAHLATMGRSDIPVAWSKTDKYAKVFLDGAGLTIRDAEGQPLSGLLCALRAIAEYDIILATGHLSREETIDLCALAHAEGVRRIILTHPLWDSTRLEIESLVELWQKYGAYCELCFGNLEMNGIDNLTLKQYIEVIRSVGSEGVILSSDLGQAFLMTVTEGLQIFFGLLEKAGVHPDDIARMSVLNPRRLLFENLDKSGEIGDALD